MSSKKGSSETKTEAPKEEKKKNKKEETAEEGEAKVEKKEKKKTEKSDAKKKTEKKTDKKETKKTVKKDTKKKDTKKTDKKKAEKKDTKKAEKKTTKKDTKKVAKKETKKVEKKVQKKVEKKVPKEKLSDFAKLIFYAIQAIATEDKKLVGKKAIAEWIYERYEKELPLKRIKTLVQTNAEALVERKLLLVHRSHQKSLGISAAGAKVAPDQAKAPKKVRDVPVTEKKPAVEAFRFYGIPAEESK